MNWAAQLSSNRTATDIPPDIAATVESLFPGNTAIGSVRQQAGGSESSLDQTRRFWLISHGAEPQREGDVSGYLAQSRRLFEASFRQLSADMTAIKAQFILRNEPAIATFFSTHRTAAPFLLRAIPELKRYFGDDVVLNLEALMEDNDSTTLYAIAIWRGAAEQADEALDDFDERWWLNQTHQPDITFTYELA